MPFAQMLDLSTAHMPGPKPDFGELRVAEHEYGFIVFVGSNAGPHSGPEVPSWLRPAHDMAVAAGCILINFDQDAEKLLDLDPVGEFGERRSSLPTWEW